MVDLVGIFLSRSDRSVINNGRRTIFCGLNPKEKKGCCGMVLGILGSKNLKGKILIGPPGILFYEKYLEVPPLPHFCCKAT